MTALIAGSADEITGPELQQMAAAASRQLAATPPITVTLGKVLYHPEAIMLAARPRDALIPVLEAARSATYEVTGQYGRPGNQSSWTPHITVSYSTARQPAEPIVSTLGHELPGRSIKISTVSLVIQRGPERQWDWNPVETIRFGAAHA
jgi:2'-5' RNA ligase